MLTIHAKDVPITTLNIATKRQLSESSKHSLQAGRFVYVTIYLKNQKIYLQK